MTLSAAEQVKITMALANDARSLWEQLKWLRSEMDPNAFLASMVDVAEQHAEDCHTQCYEMMQTVQYVICERVRLTGSPEVDGSETNGAP